MFEILVPVFLKFSPGNLCYREIVCFMRNIITLQMILLVFEL
jgi:hypothetical protein